MTPFPPPLSSTFVDTAPSPALLAGTHYPLGRALALILALCLSAYAVLSYACGRCTRRFNRGLSALDAFASATVIVGAAPRGSSPPAAGAAAAAAADGGDDTSNSASKKRNRTRGCVISFIWR